MSPMCVRFMYEERDRDGSECSGVADLLGVMKTGFEMANVYHAYGVAAGFHRLHIEAKRDRPPVQTRDFGALWQIEFQEVTLAAGTSRKLATFWRLRF